MHLKPRRSTVFPSKPASIVPSTIRRTAAALCFGAALASGLPPAYADRAPATGPQTERGAPVQAADPGNGEGRRAGAMKAYIDPKTGELVPAPAGEPAQPALPQSGAGAESQPLEEIESPAEGGGVMIDLKGRFVRPSTATIGEDGKLTVRPGVSGAHRPQN